MAKDDANTSNQTFSFEVVACLLAAMAESGVTVGSKYYTVMSQIDPARSSSGYEHHFRKVKARAKEINDMIASGDIKPAAVTPSKKGEGSKAGTPASGTKKGTKRARGPKAKDEAEDDEEVGSPSKQAKIKDEGDGED